MANVEEFTQNLAHWLEAHNYVGYDPYQLGKLRFLLARKISARLSTVFLKKLLIPKALGLIIRGNVSAFKKTGNGSLLSQNENLIQTLMDARYPPYSNPAWGVPFSWTSGFGLTYSEGYPALIVTTEIGHAFLDQYEVKPRQELKTACQNIAKSLIDEIGYTMINGQQLCFHYTNLDKYFVINTNSYAASYLARLYSIVPDERYRELALAALKFTLAHQRDDGCWFYYAPPFVDKNRAIDNRHTGFTIVSLVWANKVLKEKAIEQAVLRGWEFYRQNFVLDYRPKFRLDSLFPIDIHDAAQLIITASELVDSKLAQDCAQWTIDNMSNKEDEFYYRMYQDGTMVRIPFIRWNQAWMYRALTLLLEGVK